MNWLFQLPTTNPVAHAVGVLALVCVAGMALGSDVMSAALEGHALVKVAGKGWDEMFPLDEYY
jgi:putative transport protein